PSHPLSLTSFYCAPAHRHLHSFPTRRSSDLRKVHPLYLASEIDGGAHSTTVLRQAIASCLLLGRVDGRSEKATSHSAEEPSSIQDRKSTRLNSSHVSISYAVFCLKKKTKHKI